VQICISKEKERGESNHRSIPGLRAVSVYEANEFNLIEVAQLRFRSGIWVFRVQLEDQLGSVVLIAQGNVNQIYSECI